MFTYLISYDLGVPETSELYKILIKKIKSFGAWAKPLKSVFLIKTDKTTGNIRDELTALVDSNDRILVVDVTKAGWATFDVPKEVNEWMKNNL